MKDKLNVIKSDLMRAKLRVVKVGESVEQKTLQEAADKKVVQFDNYYVDAPYADVIIDDLTDLDLSNPCAIKRTRRYRGKYLR